MKRFVFILLALLILVPGAIIGYQVLHEPDREFSAVPVVNVAGQVERGAYLARAGDCMACHTIRGGQAYAGGRAIPTPFGTIYAPNITPHAETGIGQWTPDDFWQALHNGKSKDGSFLYPAFPYPNYTRVTRADSDAMFAYFRTLEPVNQPNRRHGLRFPYNQRLLLGIWRALNFRPGVFTPQSGQSAEWNRGAYLVQGLGHCSACHTSRTSLGGSDIKFDLGGGLIPILNWYAPSLTSGAEAGLGNWDQQHIADLLKTGVSARGAVYGPMAEVVRESLQHLADDDIRAMSGYLKSLPQSGSPPSPPAVADTQETKDVLALGEQLYRKHCADCHRENGTGYPPAYPPLAGNRSLTTASAINPVRMVLNGGYPPSTGGNPRPYGMPPFAHEFNDAQVAAVVSYLRNAWGNKAAAVSAVEVSRYRGSTLD